MRNDDAAHPGKYGFIIMNNQDHKRKPQIWGSATSSTGKSNRPSVSLVVDVRRRLIWLWVAADWC